MTQLAVFGGLAPSKHDDAAFDKMATASSYLPRLSHFTAASKRVKKKEVAPGFYVVAGKNDETPLGDDVEVVAIAWDFKALDTSGPKPISASDPESDLFKSIAARAPGSNGACQAGIEFLLWIPAVAKFATFLMASKTALREAGKLKPLIGRPATIKTHNYDNGVNVWDGPKVYESSVPPTTVPTPEQLADTVAKFNTPQVDAVPVAVEGPKRAR